MELQSLTAKHKGSIDGSLKAFYWNSITFRSTKRPRNQRKGYGSDEAVSEIAEQYSERKRQERV